MSVFNPAYSDPYGTDLAIGSTGDLIVSPSGQLETVSGPQNCVQALTMRFKTAPGALLLQPNYGSQLTTRGVGSKGNLTAIQGVVLGDLQTMLEEDPRFLQIQNLAVTPTPSPQGMGGLGAKVSCLLLLTGGQTISVSDLATARIEDVVDPATSPDTALTLEIDPLLYVPDAQELAADPLTNIDATAALAVDLAAGGVIATSAG